MKRECRRVTGIEILHPELSSHSRRSWGHRTQLARSSQPWMGHWQRSEGIYFDPLPAHLRSVSSDQGSHSSVLYHTPDEFRFHPLQPRSGRAHRRLLPPSSARSGRIVFLETHATDYLSSTKRRSSTVQYSNRQIPILPPSSTRSGRIASINTRAMDYWKPDQKLFIPGYHPNCPLP